MSSQVADDVGMASASPSPTRSTTRIVATCALAFVALLFMSGAVLSFVVAARTPSCHEIVQQGYSRTACEGAGLRVLLGIGYGLASVFASVMFALGAIAVYTGSRWLGRLILTVVVLVIAVPCGLWLSAYLP